MDIFQPQAVPLFNNHTVNQINKQYQQEPQIIPLSAPQQPIYLVRQPQQNIVPIIAIVGVVSLFGFLAFLAFMKR